MHDIMIFSLISAILNVITLPPFLLRFIRNCSLDEAWEIEKKVFKLIFSKKYPPVTVGLLQNLEFMDDLKKDWKPLSAVSIDSLLKFQLQRQKHIVLN